MTVESHFQRTRTIAARFQSAHPFLDDLDCKIPRTPHQCDPVGGQTRSPSPSAFPFRRLVVWWVFDERSTMFTRPSHRFTKSTHLASAGFTGPNLTTQPYSVGSTRLLMTVRLWCPLLVLCTAHSTDQSKYTKRLDGAGWDPALETYPGPTFASKMRSPHDEIRALLHSVLPPTGVPGRVTIWCIYPAFALPPSLLSLSLSLHHHSRIPTPLRRLPVLRHPEPPPGQNQTLPTDHERHDLRRDKTARNFQGQELFLRGLARHNISAPPTLRRRRHLVGSSDHQGGAWTAIANTHGATSVSCERWPVATIRFDRVHVRIPAGYPLR